MWSFTKEHNDCRNIGPRHEGYNCAHGAINKVVRSEVAHKPDEYTLDDLKQHCRYQCTKKGVSPANVGIGNDFIEEKKSKEGEGGAGCGKSKLPEWAAIPEHVTEDGYIRSLNKFKGRG